MRFAHSAGSPLALKQSIDPNPNPLDSPRPPSPRTASLHVTRGASRIGQYVSIGANSSISSAIVEDNVVIGARSVLEPGSYVEENVAIEAGTRVEAGAVIPSGQLWGGNPARYVRDLDGHEIAEIRSVAEQTYGASQDHAAQSTPWGMAYVQTEALRKALAK